MAVRSKELLFHMDNGRKIFYFKYDTYDDNLNQIFSSVKDLYVNFGSTQKNLY